MIPFDFEKFGFAKLVSRTMLATKLGIPKSTVIQMWSRKTVKPEVLSQMKRFWKDVEDFIIKRKPRTRKVQKGTRKRK